MRAAFSFALTARDGAARTRAAHDAARCRRDAGLHARRHLRRRARRLARGAARGRRADRAGEHLSPARAARATRWWQQLGGLHGFTGWRGPWLTDSGGYQVMSLADRARIDEDGVTFASPLDGRSRRLTPERAMQIQERARRRHRDGARRVPGPGGAGRGRRACACRPRPSARCAGPSAAAAPTRAPIRRCSESCRAARATALRRQQRGAHGRDRLRRLRARRPRPRRGERAPRRSRARGARRAAARGAALPDGHRTPARTWSPRSTPGVDLFDCVLPTRHARHGVLYTSAGSAAPAQRALSGRPRAARPRLRLPRLPSAFAGLPAPPAARRARRSARGSRASTTCASTCACSPRRAAPSRTGRFAALRARTEALASR